MNVEKIFGTRVFDDSAMKKRLPQKVYQSLLRTRRLGQPLDPQIADVVACAMKEWALEQGATHYSHWFQPMNNFTAGKHDAFLTTNGGQGEIAMEFSSKALRRIPPPSPPAACGQPLKRAATPPGTRPLRRLFGTAPSLSQPPSALTTEKHWMPRPRCCAR